MPDDFTKKAVDPKRRFSKVTMQQGRVTVDADSEETAVVQNRRLTPNRIERSGHSDDDTNASQIDDDGDGKE